MSDFRQEEWRAVVGYEGFYEISDHGRIRSMTRYVKGRHGAPRIRRSRLLRVSASNRRYPTITLGKFGVERTHLVHRLVAEAFIPRREGATMVNHKNGVKGDCRLENLEWVTPSDNNLHAYRTGLASAAGENNGQAKLTEAALVLVRRRIQDGLRDTVIAGEFGVHRRTIGDIRRGLTWRSAL